MSFKQVTLRGCGTQFNVDTSNEACGQFGFVSGDRFCDNNDGSLGTIVGVAPENLTWGDMVLWAGFDYDEPGNVGFYRDPQKSIKKI